MVLNGSIRAAEEYITHNIINPTLHDHSCPSVVIINCDEVNLRSSKNSGTKIGSTTMDCQTWKMYLAINQWNHIII